jgi:isoleucyl-tRNA synthetase
LESSLDVTKTEQHAAIYPPATAAPDFAAMEREMLEYWRDRRIFERSVELRPSRVNQASNEFVFYDGPPFANGLPHYGHLVTGFVKDLIPRYQTMRGRRVERRFGWDCHGLPAELTSEKELGLSGRQQILDYGVGKFNAHCRTSVLRFTREWQYYVTRQGRWVDFKTDYKTMDLGFMESVLWAFKRLWEKGLVYEGYRVVPYSWAVQTPLSNFETRLDNAYRERQDPALTVAFLLDPVPGESVPSRLLAWTTTPWTLPSNLALAVGPNIEYAVYEKDGHRVILAAAAAERYSRELADFRRVGTTVGGALAGRRYEPLFPYFRDLRQQKAFTVLAASFVEVGEGTGCIHIAPGFGEDDLELSLAAGLPLVVPVDEAGRFTAEIADYVGQNVIEANKPIIRDLKTRGLVFRHETYVHSYPHCWRTDTPLIYKAINAWYVKVTAFRERMTELNRGIQWIPEHIRDGQFGNWLENARDWNISRNRFWGCPIPVWRSDDPRYPRIDVYGSLDEIAADFGIRPTDLHKPMIDQLVRPNPDDPSGESVMRRVPEVLDVWFDSGSMPFAQLHYPFENRQRFDDNFPADFIVEYVAQTRGWFYTLMVLSTALFDRAPFKTCMCHGVVLDENKQKLSKRLKNYPDPGEVLETEGADALRWYMASSPLLSGGDVSLPRDGRLIGQSLRTAVLPLWNAYSFFVLYANIDGYRAKRITSPQVLLDRYVLAKTGELVRELEQRLEGYDVPGAYAAVPPYIDALNNWYIRRSRARFWREGMNKDKRDAYDSLFTALTIVSRALAPLTPFVTERIYRNLTGDESVHLTDWPDATELASEPDLVKEMDRVRDICAAAMSLREAKQLRVRLPLRQMTVAHPDKQNLEKYGSLIADEVNVKTVSFDIDPLSVAKRQLKINAKIGQRLGSRMKEVIEASRSGHWSLRESGDVQIAGLVLQPGDFTLRVVAQQGLDSVTFGSGAGIVVLDTHPDAGLVREGLARDFVRLVQQSRKDANLRLTDRIIIRARVPAVIAEAISAFEDFIRQETLAQSIAASESIDPVDAFDYKLHGQPVKISVTRIT